VTSVDPASGREARCRLHRRIAIATGVPYAILWSIYMAIVEDVGLDPAGLGIIAATGAVAGLFFGILMSAVLGRWQSRAADRRRRLTDPAAPDAVDVGVHRRSTVRVEVPAAEILRRSSDAAGVLRRGRVTAVEEADRIVKLRVGMSWRSWGERVVLRLHPQTPSVTDVTVTSRPVFPWTLVDYGRNADNVERMLEWLRALANTARAE
jgi:hypothetical protein